MRQEFHVRGVRPNRLAATLAPAERITVWNVEMRPRVDKLFAELARPEVIARQVSTSAQLNAVRRRATHDLVFDQQLLALVNALVG